MARLGCVDLSRLEPLIGITSWFLSERPQAILLRPYAFIVYEEAAVEGGGCTLHQLHKKCMDTPSALKKLHTASATYAGLKDADAFTAQLVSLPRPREAATRDAVLVPLERGCVKRGGVSRNVFSVALMGECVDIPEAPNYYGFQRFGTRRPNTHVLGKLLLQHRLGELLEEMVKIRYPHERGEALGWYERVLAKEVKASRSLQRLRRLPRTLAELFINALQSYLFNRILSLLVEQYGRAICTRYPRIPVPGCGLEDRLDASLKPIYTEVLEAEGLRPSDLCEARVYGVTAKTYPRETCIKPHGGVCRTLELQGQKVAVHMFTLPRGSYATVYLAEGYRLLEPYPDLMPC